jgi:hypothetical protein
MILALFSQFEAKNADLVVLNQGFLTKKWGVLPKSFIAPRSLTVS